MPTLFGELGWRPPWKMSEILPSENLEQYRFMLKMLRMYVLVMLCAMVP